ncbi:RHS repeat-associated core domain-containing protein [Pseudomonas frederiksbergensis]|uniref:RHS repeat-associated core domain-containing protein n=1 Tax=Pseudomonas frederiksbergensis TaxID=104087 RepID=UPI00197CDFAF|nr:RHS repeat-associated core domain-containing protein [Pseudomonas frederiksbergensis]MBN3863878.1 RHS repeat-associated core domain-containing protein [Pseudomonas frederiksbergensis]
MNTSVHWRTPSLAATDSRGLAIRQVAYLRKVAGGEVQALITRQHHDVAGRLVAQRDPRLTTPNTTTVHGLNGQPLKVHSVDAGVSMNLPGLAGEPVQTWDANDNHRRMSYDNQLRVVAVEENAVPNFETFRYANALADPGYNLRGQMIALKDPSGGVDFHSFALTGPALGETRTFHDGKTFTSRQIFSPLGAVLEHTDAGGHQQQSTYDVAGQLTQVQLKLNEQPNWQPVLQGAQYNAAGQIIEQLTGNGVNSRWRYHAADGRLLRQVAQKASEPMLQDFEYSNDRMGNITRILDHAYTPTYFANQRVDGSRAFDYDSLDRLIRATGYDDAPPEDTPGRPQPTDPNDRRNYIQTYDYDHGNNLTKLSHVRAGTTSTHQMFIDPDSNRGVRWKSGAPDPDFPVLFDRAGNLQALQPGQSMQWNNQNQLESVTLVEHATGPNDTEQYRYSQGERVYKRHETHTAKVSHFHEVRYLRGLEIRTRDNGEELHLITLVAGVSNVTCLHWVAGKQPGIDANQLRYPLVDHLGSCLKELDQRALLISDEGYYPYGGKAWLVARSLIEVDYKFIRYAGKETDVTGLIYYGARYYAPWLGRWISPDPKGAVDGLNLYAFVGNNPLRYTDPTGAAKAESVIMLYSGFISALGGVAEQTLVQIDNVIHQKNIKSSLFKNTVGEVASGIAGYEAGNIGGEQVSLHIPNVRHIVAHKRVDRLPFIEALTGGNAGGDVAGGMAAPVTGMGLIGALIPQTSNISVASIDRQLGIPEAVKDIQLNSWRNVKDEVIHPALNSVLNPDFMMNRVMASWLSILPGAFNLLTRAVEAEDIKNRLDPVKVGKIETMLGEWKEAVEQRSAWAESAFDALGTDVIHPADFIPNVTHMTSSERLAPITRAGLQQTTTKTLDYINRMQKGMAWYKEMGTTDNQFLSRQRAARH